MLCSSTHMATVDVNGLKAKSELNFSFHTPLADSVKPLCRRSVHYDVDPQDLHRVEWVRQLHDR